MTTLILVRHAHTDAIGVRLCGRAPGVHLSTLGRADADRLGRGLAAESMAAIYASPLERAVETATAIAKYQQRRVDVHDGLSEIDFGDWTGKTFAELDLDPRWHTFNTCRSTAPVPRGEAAAATQSRIVAALETLAALHPGQRIAIVSHGDPLRYALLHFAGVALDHYDDVELLPASVSVVLWKPDSARLLCVNDRRFADALDDDEGAAPRT